MEPIILIHGYSAESNEATRAAVAAIYGTLQADLIALTGIVPPIVNVNISRYISLDDGVSLEDVTIAFDRALRAQFPNMDDPAFSGFNAIIHSTGALVIRNWIRRFSSKPSPCKRIIHLAGANFGSGWAHIGETLLAKWLRYIGQQGAERGLAVLEGLELGSSWAIDLHRYFLEPGQDMLLDYGVQEFNIIGSQVPPEWLVIPFRYGKEDGSDGVVRVSASNLNHHYVRIGPRRGPGDVDWDQAAAFSQSATQSAARGEVAGFTPGDPFAGGYYSLIDDCRPGVAADPMNQPKLRPRAQVPLAIPYRCAHSTETIGVVYGTQTRADVLPLIESALLSTPGTYSQRIAVFDAVTQRTYDRVKQPAHTQGLFSGVIDSLRTAVTNYLDNPFAQYDRHAQLIVRVRDQNGQAVKDVSIHFNSQGGDGSPQQLIDVLFEDKHTNNAMPGTTTFYLRLEHWDAAKNDWVSRLPGINGVDLEIDSIDADTDRILFVPLRLRINAAQLAAWLQPHRTTIIDIEMLRLPSRDTFILY